jgi:hypothetical protein
VAISADEAALGQVRVRASSGQAERLLEWAQAWPQRAWAVEGARGMGHLLAQQLVAAGERVLDVQPKLGARVRLLAAGDTNKNDPNDARSVAVAALRSPGALPWRRSVEQCRSGLSVPCSPCSSYGLSAAFIVWLVCGGAALAASASQVHMSQQGRSGRWSTGPARRAWPGDAGAA